MRQVQLKVVLEYKELPLSQKHNYVVIQRFFVGSNMSRKVLKRDISDIIIHERRMLALTMLIVLGTIGCDTSSRIGVDRTSLQLVVYNREISRAGFVGPNMLPQVDLDTASMDSFKVWNTRQDGSVLDFAIGADVSWLDIEPIEGRSRGPNDRTWVTITLNSLPPTYQGGMFKGGSVMIRAGRGRVTIPVVVNHSVDPSPWPR